MEDTCRFELFFSDDLRSSKLCQSLEYFSCEFGDMNTERVFAILSSMPSLKKLRLHDADPDMMRPGISMYLYNMLCEESGVHSRNRNIDRDRIEEYSLSFPNVSLKLELR